MHNVFENLPAVETKKAIELVGQVKDKIKLVHWNNEEIKLKFGRRSGKEVLLEGNSFYMNPCLDLTLATSSLLENMEIPFCMAIEEHAPTPDYHLSRIHFVIELPGRYINYMSGRKTVIGEGFYNGHPSIPQIGIQRINGSKVKSNMSLPEILDVPAIELIGMRFKKYQFVPQLTKILDDNTQRRYEAYSRLSKNSEIQVAA